MRAAESIISIPSMLKLAADFLTASAVVAGGYWLFFYFAPAIWSCAGIPDRVEFTPWLRIWAEERDGIEMYALYGLMFGVMALTWALAFLRNGFKSRVVNYAFYLLAATAALCFYADIGFHPPLPEPGNVFQGLFFVSLTALVLLILQKYSGRVKGFFWILFLGLMAVCLTPASGISLVDYNYVLTPALKIARNFKLRETYCQYDYFLPLVASLWLKLKLSAYSFYRLAEVSYVFFLSGIYLLARRLFLHKRWADYVLVSLVIIRIYGNMSDPVFCLQITPLRLDWWLVVLACVYWKGAQHWLVGLGLGFLMVFHHVFGLIYAFSYILFVLFLAAGEAAGKKPAVKSLAQKYRCLYTGNMIVIIAAWAVYKLFFSPGAGTAALIYQKYNIGFMPIARQSFYWYVPVIFALLVILGWRNRRLLPEKYYQTGLLLVILAVGNSIYFFGRSHEHNIINIAGSLVFCFFLLADLAHYEISKNTSAKTNLFLVPGIVFLLVVGLASVYSGRAMQRIGQQYAYNRSAAPLKQLLPQPLIAEIKTMTASDSRVIFMTRFDFPFYYEGGYLPSGYYCFTDSWVFLQDYSDFLNAQLAAGYYLVLPRVELPAFYEIVARLRCGNIRRSPDFLVMNNPR